MRFLAGCSQDELGHSRLSGAAFRSSLGIYKLACLDGASVLLMASNQMITYNRLLRRIRHAHARLSDTPP